jgi:molybdenum cofactor cytidylyltransferase
MNTGPASIGCIVLAAGSSKRFGADKRLAGIAGTTLLELTLGSIPQCLSRRLLLLHPGDEALAARLQPAWQVIIATDAHLGMGHSLAAAMPYTQAWSGAVIVLADMPYVHADTYTSIQQHLGPDRLVVPHYRGQRGNPVGIGRDYFAALAQLRGDQGARVLFQLHAAALLRLEVDDPGILRDIDTREALREPAGSQDG